MDRLIGKSAIIGACGGVLTEVRACMPEGLRAVFWRHPHFSGGLPLETAQKRADEMAQQQLIAGKFSGTTVGTMAAK